MIQSNDSVRKHQIARIVQKELGALFLSEKSRLFNNSFISVSAVYLGKDFGVARVYLSFSLNEKKHELLKKVQAQKSMIRKLLGKKIAHKARRIPDLVFCIDDSVMQGAAVTALIDQLNLDNDNLD